MPNLSVIGSQKYYFKSDDSIPNNSLPVLIYKTESSSTGDNLADLFETTFAENGWRNTWIWGMYDYHHFHSNTFEVLAVFKGHATIQLGGHKGLIKDIVVGDVIILPPGIGHKCQEHSPDFTLVGAYPNGIKPDLHRSYAANKVGIITNIENVKMYEKDPIGNQTF